MEPSRQKAYLALIQQLLQCASGEETAVLESHRELLDSGFVAMCEEVAQTLEEHEDVNTAHWLRILVTQLGESVSTGGSSGGRCIVIINADVLHSQVADQQKAFLMKLSRAIAIWLLNLGTLLGKLTGPVGRKAWASTNTFLGTARCILLAPGSSNPGYHFQNAIVHFNNALRIYTEARQPRAWAHVNNLLGAAYRELAPFTDTPGEQIQKSITAFNNALRVFTEEKLPGDWADTNNNLGTAYKALASFSPNPAKQIQKAIVAYNNALRVRSEEKHPREWAMTKSNLGNAYRALAPHSANPGELIQNGIAAHSNALRVRTEKKLPKDYAITNINLGAAFLDLASFSTNLEEQIQKAIVAFRNALRVFTEEENPQYYASTNINLGGVFAKLASFSTNPEEQIQKAIEAHSNALRVFTEDQYPHYYSITNNNLGDVFADLASISTNPEEQIQKAIVVYSNALRVSDSVHRSNDCLRSARNLGNLCFVNNLPEIAINAYLLGISAVENLRSVAIDPARRAEIISQSIEVYANLVQVYVDQQQLDKALEVADRSKTRNLAELLTTKDLCPKGEYPVEVIIRLDELRGRIARAERELNKAEKWPPFDGVESMPSGRLQQQSLASAADNLVKLKEDLEHLIWDEILQTDPTFSLNQVQPMSIEQLRTILPDDRTVLVSWYVAGPNLMAFILAKGTSEPSCHRYPKSTLGLLLEEQNSYLSTYLSNRSLWLSELPETLNRLSIMLEMEALAETIAKIAPQADQLILVPHRFLHLLPLHCLPFRDPTTTLLDMIPRGVRFAPSLQVLDVVQKRPQKPLNSLFAVQNPTEDLLHTDLEVEAVQSLFAYKRTVLMRSEATKGAIEQQAGALANSNCVHFACHGTFNFQQPELSSLILAGSASKPEQSLADANRDFSRRDCSAVDLSQCLTLLDLFELDLRQAHLVALSACETGLSELNSLSDEFVGLSSGFLYAGCNSVIGTLWTVNDLSTGLLMGEFYRMLKQQEQTQPSTDVALALKQAQQWLRQLTCAEAVDTLQRLVPSLDADVQETAKRSIRRSLSERYAADDRPYCHPFYWAAFCAVGQ